MIASFQGNTNKEIKRLLLLLLFCRKFVCDGERGNGGAFIHQQSDWWSWDLSFWFLKRQTPGSLDHLYHFSPWFPEWLVTVSTYDTNYQLRPQPIALWCKMQMFLCGWLVVGPMIAARNHSALCCCIALVIVLNSPDQLSTVNPSSLSHFSLIRGLIAHSGVLVCYSPLLCHFRGRSYAPCLKVKI